MRYTCSANANKFFPYNQNKEHFCKHCFVHNIRQIYAASISGNRSRAHDYHLSYRRYCYFTSVKFSRMKIITAIQQAFLKDIVAEVIMSFYNDFLQVRLR